MKKTTFPKLYLSKSADQEKINVHWKREVNWTYIRRSEDLQTFSESYMYNQIHALCSGARSIKHLPVQADRSTIQSLEKGMTYVQI